MNEDTVRSLLAEVEDPTLGEDIVSHNLINNIEISDDDVARISLALGAPCSTDELDIKARVREVLNEEGIESEIVAEINREASGGEVLPGVENIIAVASGKGGVGKSTVAVNLAAGISYLGANVGLFDADIYGPNTPEMIEGDVRDTGVKATPEETLIPAERHGVNMMSMDFITGEDQPVIWRGPMIHKILTQFIDDVEWGELDYMVVDLPPGTGDTQLSLLQSIPITGAVIVTTPQGVAVDDAKRGLEMFGKHDTSVLGIVENMSGFQCPDCGSEHDIFGESGGEEFAEEYDLPFLGEIPLDPSVREGGDDGEPIILDSGDTTDAFRTFTENTLNNVGTVRRHYLSNS